MCGSFTALVRLIPAFGFFAVISLGACGSIERQVLPPWGAVGPVAIAKTPTKPVLALGKTEAAKMGRESILVPEVAQKLCKVDILAAREAFKTIEFTDEKSLTSGPYVHVGTLVTRRTLKTTAEDGNDVSWDAVVDDVIEHASTLGMDVVAIYKRHTVLKRTSGVGLGDATVTARSYGWRIDCAAFK